GMAHVEAAAAMDRDLVVPAANAAFPFLVACGRVDDARAWRLRALEEEMENAAAAQERRHLHPREPLAPHEASPAEVERLAALLDTFPVVRAAYLVRRALRYRPDVPAHLLVLDVGRYPDEKLGALVRAIAARLELADEAWVEAPKRRRIRQAKRIAGSEVYRCDPGPRRWRLPGFALAR
ncbi:MAG TPA: hypothetical protein VJT67_03810, partial [Longimicrobiaceae bacterium]|nr:hypothetical protein [Longimicrobiaceae bacterium]